MKLIIGLGNPGKKYENTRHNVGHMVIDQLSQTLNSKPQIQIFKSQNFMNDSGSFVSELTTNYKLPTTNLFIVHDDLDLPLGSYKIQFGKGPKDHNGLNDIYKKLGTKDFWHVRIGIENRIKNEESRVRGEQYVLENFTDNEKKILGGAINEVCKKLAIILKSTN